jgi:glycosyltransferase involved in cell wall biosynthesis
MALGVPSVAFDCDFGPCEITGEGKDAMLVPANDWPALENVLRELIDSPAIRCALGKKGAAAVRERFSLDQVLQRWETLFDVMTSLREAR